VFAFLQRHITAPVKTRNEHNPDGKKYFASKKTELCTDRQWQWALVRISNPALKNFFAKTPSAGIGADILNKCQPKIDELIALTSLSIGNQHQHIAFSRRRHTSCSPLLRFPENEYTKYNCFYTLQRDWQCARGPIQAKSPKP